MKFYDENGKKHKTLIGAVAANVQRKADNFIRNQMPSYEDTINENEHLYDAITERHAVYPSKDGTVTGTTATADHKSHSEIKSDEIDTQGKDVIRKHWNSTAVFTDAWRPGINEEKLTETELLQGELSAVIFHVGCYTVRSAQRVYSIQKASNSQDLEMLADQIEVEFVKNISPAYVGAPSLNGRLLRVINEISAKHHASPNNVFAYVCRAILLSGSMNWCEYIGDIYTVKGNDSIPDEYASLLVSCHYEGSSFGVDTWYRLDPTGKVTKLELHPFNSNIGDESFK